MGEEATPLYKCKTIRDIEKVKMALKINNHHEYKLKISDTASQITDL